MGEGGPVRSGPGERLLSRRFAARASSLKHVRCDVRDAVTGCGCSPERGEEIVLAVDEAHRRIKLSIRAVRHPPDKSEAGHADHRPAAHPAKPAQRRKPKGSLKGGMGQSDAMGMGLGDLKL